MCNKKINVSIFLKNYYYNFIKFLKRIATHKNKNWQQTKGKKKLLPNGHHFVGKVGEMCQCYENWIHIFVLKTLVQMNKFNIFFPTWVRW